MRKPGVPTCAPMPVQLGPPEPERKSVTVITLDKLREEWTAPLRARIEALERAIKLSGATCMAHEDPAVPMSEDGEDSCVFCVATPTGGEVEP